MHELTLRQIQQYVKGCKQMTAREATPQSPQTIDAQLKDVLAHFPQIVLAVLFGSVAVGRQRADSDLDMAVAAKQALTAHEKIALVSALAERTGRPIDLIDLKVVSHYRKKFRCCKNIRPN